MGFGVHEIYEDKPRFYANQDQLLFSVALTDIQTHAISKGFSLQDTFAFNLSLQQSLGNINYVIFRLENAFPDIGAPFDSLKTQ